MGIRRIDLADEDAVANALQRLLDRVVTADNIARVLDDEYGNPIHQVIYWKEDQPPLASVSLGRSSDKLRMGVHMNVLTLTALSSDFLGRLRLALPPYGVRFSITMYGAMADLVMPTDELKAGAVKVVKH